MAYADYQFYTDSFFGDVLTNDNFDRLASRASDFMDTVTFKRLVNGLPSDEWDAGRVKKCACAMAETYYYLDLAQKNANASVVGGSSSGNSGESGSGAIKSVSSGSESITYMTPAEQSGGSSQWSAAFAAASDKAKTNDLLMATAKEYLSGISDDSGVLLLFAGV